MQHKPEFAGSTQQGILLMDDDPAVRLILTQILETTGYRIHAVDHGEGAIAAFLEARDRGDRYGCVVLDLQITNGMGGTETIRRLKKIDPHINSILISGSTDDPAFVSFRASGFDVALKKPFSGEQLLSAIDRLLPPTPKADPSRTPR